MYYRDTTSNLEPQEAEIRLDQGEVELMLPVMGFRSGQDNFIYKSLHKWLSADRGDKHEPYIVRGEGARQLRMAVGEAATGAVLRADGMPIPIPEPLQAAMDVMDGGDEALRLGQVPVDAAALETAYATTPEVASNIDTLHTLLAAPTEPQSGRHRQ